MEYRKRKREEINSRQEQTDQLLVEMAFPKLSRSIIKAKRNLPKDDIQRLAVVNSLFQEHINSTPRKKRLITT